MSVLAILADDFTGACDAAAPFAATGLRAMVSLRLPEALADDLDVVALDLDVRERSADDAREAAHRAAHSVLALQPSARLFVKIDSTLRGPIDGLVNGALAGSNLTRAVIAPAFPEQGRFLIDGRLRLGHDSPPSSDSLTEELHATHIDANAARTGESFEIAMRSVDSRVVVVDADSAACLASVAEAWARHPEWLLVGSSGLARRLAAPSATHPAVVPEQLGSLTNILIVAGSPAEASQKQLARLPKLVNVRIVSGGASRVRDQGQTAVALAETLALTPRPGALVLVGGQTGRQVCHRLGASGVEIHGELQPGIPYGRLLDGAWDGLPVVTKAGGFGGEDALLDVVHAFGVSSAPAT